MNEIRGIEYETEVTVFAALHEIDAAVDRIAVDALFVLVQQSDARCSRSFDHCPQALYYRVSKLVKVHCPCCRGRVKRKNAYIGRLKEVRDCNCTFKTLQVFVKIAVDGHLADR